MKRYEITITYQLGAIAHATASTSRGLARIIRSRRNAHDCQGIRYQVESASIALALKCYETQYGQWVEPSTETVIEIES